MGSAYHYWGSHVLGDFPENPSDFCLRILNTHVIVNSSGDMVAVYSTLEGFLTFPCMEGSKLRKLIIHVCYIYLHLVDSYAKRRDPKGYSHGDWKMTFPFGAPLIFGAGGLWAVSWLISPIDLTKLIHLLKDG